MGLGQTALLVIDVQNAMFDVGDPVYEGERLLANIKQLIAKARKDNAPVFYIQHSDEGLEKGSEAWKIHADIQRWIRSFTRPSRTHSIKRRWRMN